MAEGIVVPISTPGADKASQDLNRVSDALGKIGDGATKSAFSFNQIRQALTSAISDVNAFAESVTALASEQAQLDANSARLGLNFDAAAEAAGRFTDETEAMTAATRLNEAGIRLSQTQLDALTRVAARFAQNTGVTTREAIDTLTQGLITGSERGLRPFGGELVRVAGESHTAEQRLAALTTQAGHTERATDDAASSFERFKDSLEDAQRTLASGFAEGIMRMTELGNESDNAAEKAENLNRTLHAIGASIGETIARVTVGVGELLGFVAIAVTSITSGLAAIGGGLVHLASGHIRGIGAAMTSAAQYGGIGAASEFTSRMDELRRQQSEAAERETTLAAPMAAPARPGVSSRRGGGGGGGGGGQDSEVKAIEARVQILHDSETRVRAEIEHTQAIRERAFAIEFHGMEQTNAALEAQVALRGRAADEERVIDERVVERLRIHIAALREREPHLRGEERARAQHTINELLGEESAHLRRIEMAENQVADAEQRRVDIAHAADEARRVELATEVERLTHAREILSIEERTAELRTQAADGEMRLTRARSAQQRQESRVAVSAELADLRDPAVQRERIDEMRRAHTLERERAHLTQRYEMQRTFVDRMEELNEREVNGNEALATSITSAFRTTGDALSAHLQAFADGRETAAEAMQNMLADTLKNIGKESLAKAGFYFATGLGNLATLNFPGAATAFAASAAFAAVGGGLIAGGNALTDTNTLGARNDAAKSAESSSREPAARVSGSRGASESAGTVYNITFGGPMYGTGGVRQAARQMVGAINRGGIQGGVQLLPGVLQGAGAGT